MHACRNDCLMSSPCAAENLPIPWVISCDRQLATTSPATGTVSWPTMNCRTTSRSASSVTIGSGSGERLWKRPSGRSLPAVSQSGRDPVDGELNAVQQLLVALVGTMLLQQLDLHVVERIEIREAVADRAVEEGVVLEKLRSLRNTQQHRNRGFV